MQKFEIIEKGLQSIFTQINQGLNSYEQTVSSNIQEYLSKFSTTLTETSRALEGAFSEQKDILIELTDFLDGLNKKNHGK